MDGLSARVARCDRAVHRAPERLGDAAEHPGVRATRPDRWPLAELRRQPAAYLERLLSRSKVLHNVAHQAGWYLDAIDGALARFDTNLVRLIYVVCETQATSYDQRFILCRRRSYCDLQRFWVGKNSLERRNATSLGVPPASSVVNPMPVMSLPSGAIFATRPMKFL